MPPGASLLMKGLGMREIDRHNKTQKRGRRDLDKYDRPIALPHNRHDYPNVEILPYLTEEEIALLDDRYLDGDHGSLGGLSDDYVWRLFEWERSRQRRRGYINPFEHVRGRKARDRLEFEDWLRRHPDRERLEAIRATRYNQGHHNLRYDHERHGHHGGATSREHPHTRRGGGFDIREPRHRPRNPRHPMNREEALRVFEAFMNPRGRHPRRHPRRVRHPVHDLLGYNNTRLGPLDHPHDDLHVPRHGHRTRHPRHHFPFPTQDYNHLPELDSDLGTFSSSHSYNRHRHPARPLSPRIVHPTIPPYYGRPLPDDTTFTTDDDDDEDEYDGDEFGRRVRGHGGRRRAFRHDEEGEFSGQEDDEDFDDDEDDDED